MDDYCRDHSLTKTCAEGWCNATGECPNVMGYTMRVDEWRYTAWVPFYKCENCTRLLSDWDARGYGAELYSHSDAPVPTSYHMETINLAGSAALQTLEARLREQLREFVTRGHVQE